MHLIRTLVPISATAALLVGAAATSAEASPRRPAPVVTDLATFGAVPGAPDIVPLGSGSTIGPDGALYVTDGNNGSVLRIDRRSGRRSLVATGLPKRTLPIGGAMDIAFVGRTAYVLVTMVGGDLLLPTGTVHFGDAVDGIYRLERDGSFTVVADIGAWTAAHPPRNTDFFISTGVQYALQPSRGGFVVTDGHHNRVLFVDRNGNVSALRNFTDVVPTGLETAGGTVFVAEAGPVPHHPSDAKVVALNPPSQKVREVASGTGAQGPGLTVDVEFGPHHQLYAVLQGVWDLPNDPANAGSPASANTGVLVRVDRDGSFSPVVGGLDRPTSLEIVDDTAYVVGLGGTVTRIDHISPTAR